MNYQDKTLEELLYIKEDMLKKQQEKEEDNSKNIEIILKEINNQRWFLLNNYKDVVLDTKTGVLWPNLDYYDISIKYSIEGAKKLIKDLKLGKQSDWVISTLSEIKDLRWASSKYPFSAKLNDTKSIIAENEIGDIKGYERCAGSWFTISTGSLLPKNKVFEKQVYSLDMSLSIFTDNDLEPIFTDKEIDKLYRSIYIEKPILLDKLNEIQQKIDELQTEVLLSSTFDYKTILINYDINSIDSSIIKYYEAIQSCIDDLISKLQYFEEVKWDVIREFNVCGLKLSKKYEDNPKLDEEENTLLKNRQVFLRKNIDLGMSSVKTKLLSVKNQADKLESRIEEINDSENSILLLAELEEEKRASFNFIAENTANIIKNALLKVEYFEANKDLVTNIINSESKWSENYKVFKTKDKEELKSLSEEDGIEEDVYMSWYEDWRNKKYILEKSFTELINQGIKKSIVSVVKDENESKYMIEEVICILEQYSKSLDDFYKNERKNIHQKYAFVPGGDIQEKLEVESDLYKITVKFQNRLQDIIFKLDSVEDRIFLLRWAESIIDLQVNEVLYFVKDKDFNKISETILNQFADLKRSNIENYISDAQLYSEEKSNREKQFNSLMYKMRKELMA